MKPTLNQLVNEFESKLNRKLRDIELKVLEFLVNTDSDSSEPLLSSSE
jgi:hypothetical protein